MNTKAPWVLVLTVRGERWQLRYLDGDGEETALLNNAYLFRTRADAAYEANALGLRSWRAVPLAELRR